MSEYETFGETRERLLTEMRSLGLIGRLIAWRYDRRFRKIQDDQRRRISKAMDK